MPNFNQDTTGNEVVDAFADRVKGRTIVITGPSSKSLGAETATTLARGHPAKLILLARNAAKVQPVLDQIHKIDPKISAVFVSVDLDSFESVHSAASQVNSLVDKVDYLINNAGVMAVKTYTLSRDGVESQLAINHLSHFLLTALLWPKIVKAAEGQAGGGVGPRVVTVASDGYTICPVLFDDWNFSGGKTYDMWSAYGQSKTAQVLFTRHLASIAKSRRIQVFTVHPGVVMSTNLGDHVTPSDFAAINDIAIKNTGKPFEMNPPKSIQRGVSTCLRALLDPDLEGDSGAYLEDCQVKDVYEYAKDKGNEERMWELSERLTGQKLEL